MAPHFLPPTSLLIGVISDTHGLMRPEALVALAGCAHILHAGDVGSPEVLCALRKLAPLTVVRGNNDRAPWADSLPARARVQFGTVDVYLLHDLAELDLDPAKEGIDVVVAGHSHQSGCSQKDGVLMVNPGSAGPRRFKLPITLAFLHIGADGSCEFIVRSLPI